MKKEKKHIIQTEQAWEHLYNRLLHDGLFTEYGIQQSSIISSLRKISWVAIFLLLCISIITLFYTNRLGEKTDTTLLTLQNKKDAATLVKTLEDGSIVYLADNSQLQYPEHFQTDKRIVTLKGDALFDVSGNKERPFFIETDDMQIEVLGTAFNIINNENKPFELSVLRGSVKVTSMQNKTSVLVNAGETVTLLVRQLQINATQDTKQFARYTQLMQFKDERLADILRVINLTNPEMQIQATPDIEDHRLTVRFTNNSPDEIARLLCAALNLKYTQDKNTLFIKP
ncbi:FecR family protein [Parabacteroides bouchesdurhonensis]|uniref:FecR family protein n=1 Tax=Parabacteroides bouchesdurhonensis TaxID=1936995 RepID=UPI000C849373|nr:FecR domain-containing protein [Parabacteroides bouchesdurhonensis]